MSLFFFVVVLVKLRTSFRFAPKYFEQLFVVILEIQRETHLYTLSSMRGEMFARRKSSVVLLLLFSLVVLLSVSSFSGDGFTACFGFNAKNKTRLLYQHRIDALCCKERVCVPTRGAF